MAEGKKEVKTAVTPLFRASFVDGMFNKKQFGEGKPKFGLTALWRPAQFTDAEKKLWAVMGELADEASMALHKKRVKDLPANFKKPVRDGLEKEHLDGYGAGVKFANMTSLQKPGLVDRNKKTITDQELFYAGCYARALVTAYAYDKNGGKGVAFGLVNVQKVKDGEPFSFHISAEESFDDDLGPEEEGAASSSGEEPF